MLGFLFKCLSCYADQDVALKGWYSYDAAVQCAAFSAGARVAAQPPTSNQALLAASTDASGPSQPSGPDQALHTVSTHALRVPSPAVVRQPAATARGSSVSGVSTCAALGQAARRAVHQQAVSMHQHVPSSQLVHHAGAANPTAFPHGLRLSQAGDSGVSTHAAASQVSGSRASSATAFAGAICRSPGPVLLQPQLACTARNGVSVPTQAVYVARTVSTESSAASGRQQSIPREAVVRREDLLANSASMIPSMLTFLGRDRKRPRHAHGGRPAPRA